MLPSGKPPLEVFARAAAQLAAVNELPLELEVPINADDQQLLEIALALDQYVVARLFGRDGLDLDTLALNRAVRAGRVGRMAAKTKLQFHSVYRVWEWKFTPNPPKSTRGGVEMKDST